MEYAGIDHYDGSGLRIISDDHFHNDIIGKILSSNLLGEVILMGTIGKLRG